MNKLLTSAWILLFGTLALYFFGAISGYTSKQLLVVFGTLLLLQLVIGAVKRAWSIVAIAISGVGILFFWQMAGWIHDGIRAVTKKEPMLQHMTAVTKAGSFLLSFMPFIIVVAIAFIIAQTRGFKFERLFNMISKSNVNRYKEDYPSIRIGWDPETKKEIYIPGMDRFTHTGLVAPTGGGKTFSVFEPMCNQDMEYIAVRNRGRLIVMEPDGEFTETLQEYAEHLRIPNLRLDAMNPGEFHWNCFEGPIVETVETITTVLKYSFGRQQAFFSLVQESAGSNTAMLLKLIAGNDCDIVDFTNVLRNMEEVKKMALTLKGQKRGLSEEERYMADNVIAAILSEMKTDVKAEAFERVCMGLRQQLEVIIRNPNIRKIMSGKSSFTFDEIFDQPGALFINTGNNAAGDFFGKFLLLSMQSSVLRRPGKANTRLPVYTYIDEFPRYANEKFDEVFTQGRKYRTAMTLAYQGFTQMKDRCGEGYMVSVLNNSRNKIIMTGLESFEAKIASEMLLEEEITEQSVTFNQGFFGKNDERLSERNVTKRRFSPSTLNTMPADQVVYKIVENRQPKEPAPAIVKGPMRKTREQLFKEAGIKESKVKALPAEEPTHELEDIEKPEKRGLKQAFKGLKFNLTLKLPSPNLRLSMPKRKVEEIEEDEMDFDLEYAKNDIDQFIK